MIGGNGKSEFYGAGKKARDRPREDLMLQLESEGRIPSFLGTFFFFFLNLLTDWIRPTCIMESNFLY